MKALITLFLLSFSTVVLGQGLELGKVDKPQFGTFKTVETTSYYENSALISTKQYTQKSTFSLGAHADDIIRQTYSNVQGPIYPIGATQQQIQKANMQYIQRNMANDPAYGHPNKSNGFSQMALNSHKAVLNVLNEVHNDSYSKSNTGNSSKSASPIADTKPYKQALNHLKEQLTGKRNLSVSDTYFVVENAFGNTYLTKKEYDQIIDESVKFIYAYMDNMGLDKNDNEAKNKAIQQFLSQELTIDLNFSKELPQKKKITHVPFAYDYEDFKSQKDYRNHFITKCIATGFGQCNSLPGVHLVLSERMNATTYLAIAPQHSLVKYPDAEGIIHSYEPTSNWNMSDKWYKDHMFISPEAIRNGIYLAPLNRQQIVANSVLDLALGYMQKHGASDGQFVKECIQTVLPYFPKNNNIQTDLVYSGLLARQLDRILYEHNIKDLRNINKTPQAASLYEALRKNEAIIKRKGYQDMPEKLYEQIMLEHEFKGVKQKEEVVSGKEKRNLFKTTF